MPSLEMQIHSEASYTDSLGYLFVITLIFIWKLRSISTTNREGVNISKPTFNCKKVLARFQAFFYATTHCYSSSARVYTEDREQTQSSLCLLITQKMKKDKSRSTKGWML